MESFADGIGNLIGFQLVLSFMFIVYLAPSIIAVVRGHHRWPWIGFLNLAAGWTVIGWIAALVCSVTTMRQASSDRADRQNYRKTTPEATPSAAA
jgi:Na+/melibiose symporter-like transporter